MEKKAVLGIAQMIAKKAPTKNVDEWEMKHLAYEGCGAKVLKGIEDKNAYAVAQAIKDIVKLCMDELEEK